jgi:hypothetical protein
MSNEGYANLAAALMSFFGSRSKSRREDRRERERTEREDRRHADEMDLRRSDLAMRGDVMKENVGLQRETLDRVHPKKTITSDLYDLAKQMLVKPSGQERLLNSQAGYYDAIAGQVGKGMTPPIAPGMPKMPGMGASRKPAGGGRQPKAPKEPTMDLVSPADFADSIAKDLVMGVQSQFRQSGQPYDPRRTDWKTILMKNRNAIAKRMGRMPTDQELASIMFAITGGADPTSGESIPGYGEKILLRK